MLASTLRSWPVFEVASEWAETICGVDEVIFCCAVSIVDSENVLDEPLR